MKEFPLIIVQKYGWIQSKYIQINILLCFFFLFEIWSQNFSKEIFLVKNLQVLYEEKN